GRPIPAIAPCRSSPALWPASQLCLMLNSSTPARENRHKVDATFNVTFLLFLTYQQGMSQAEIIVALVYPETRAFKIMIKLFYAVETAVAVCHTGKIERRSIQTERRRFKFLCIPEQFHN